MAGTVEKRLAELGTTLPRPKPPVANYVPFVRTGNFMVVSGQLCLDGKGKLVAKGQLGGAVSVEDGQKAARACAAAVSTSPLSPAWVRLMPTSMTMLPGRIQSPRIISALPIAATRTSARATSAGRSAVRE